MGEASEADEHPEEEECDRDHEQDAVAGGCQEEAEADQAGEREDGEGREDELHAEAG